jgi:thioredoxin-like negative regulator of GroEL
MSAEAELTQTDQYIAALESELADLRALVKSHPHAQQARFEAAKAAIPMFTCETALCELESAIRERMAEKPAEDRRRMIDEIVAKRCVFLADALLKRLAETAPAAEGER